MSKPEPECGTLADVFEGDRLRFVGAEEWYTVYATFGCLCGECRESREVLYYEGEWPGYCDKDGCPPCACESATWEWYERPRAVEWIEGTPLTAGEKATIVEWRFAAWCARQKETAEYKSADPISNPSGGLDA